MQLSRAIVLLTASGLAPSHAHASITRFVPAPVRRVTQRVTQVMGKQILAARAKTKLALDHTEMKLNISDRPRTAQALAATRRTLSPFSPLKLSGFIGTHLKEHPLVGATFSAMYVPVEALRVATLPMLPLKLVAPAFAISSVPLTVALFIGAEYVNRRGSTKPDENVTLGSMLHDLRGEYAAYRLRDAQKLKRMAKAMKRGKDST